MMRSKAGEIKFERYVTSESQGTPPKCVPRTLAERYVLANNQGGGEYKTQPASHFCLCDAPRPLFSPSSSYPDQLSLDHHGHSRPPPASQRTVGTSPGGLANTPKPQGKQRKKKNHARLIIKSTPARCAKPGARILHRYGRFDPSDTRYTPISPFGASIAL